MFLFYKALLFVSNFLWLYCPYLCLCLARRWANHPGDPEGRWSRTEQEEQSVRLGIIHTKPHPSSFQFSVIPFESWLYSMCCIFLNSRAQITSNCSICCSPSDSAGKRVGPPPDPTPPKRTRVEQAPAPNAAPQAVRPPLFLPQVLLPGPQRLFLQPVAAPYVPQLPNMPPLNYNVPNANFDFNLPMHYGPPHRFFRPLWTACDTENYIWTKTRVAPDSSIL